MTDKPAPNSNGLIHKKPLRDEVFDLLSARVIAGEYAPGHWLRQEELASQLGVSQTPVREALDLLASAGLAERVPYRGVRIRQLTQSEILDAYILRLQLECLAARLAALNITPPQSEQLLQVVVQTRSLVTLQDMLRLRQLNLRFHSLIAEFSSNALLAHLYRMVSNIFPDWMLYEHLFRHPEMLRPSLESEFQEHLSIAQAIASGDASTAARRVVAHIRNLAGALVRSSGLSPELLQQLEGQVLTWLSLQDE